MGESENASLLKDNLNRQTAIQAELDRLNNGQKNNSDQILQTQKAYQELLKGRINWLVDEAESMLNTASQQLMLSGNLKGAVSVLEHIDSRLSRFEQPELIPIKQAISNDLAALKTVLMSIFPLLPCVSTVWKAVFQACLWFWTAY